MIKFGPSGNSESFFSEGYKHTKEMPEPDPSGLRHDVAGQDNAVQKDSESEAENG